MQLDKGVVELLQDFVVSSGVGRLLGLRPRRWWVAEGLLRGFCGLWRDGFVGNGLCGWRVVDAAMLRPCDSVAQWDNSKITLDHGPAERW